MSLNIKIKTKNEVEDEEEEMFHYYAKQVILMNLAH